MLFFKYSLYSQKNLELRTGTSTFEKCILYYRAIYILSNEFNSAFGILFIPMVKLALIGVAMLSFFALIIFWDVMDIVGLGTIIFVLFNSIFLLIPVSIIMSGLYGSSVIFRHNLQNYVQLINNKKTRKYYETLLKSCPIIRCQIGSFYHMEAKAKLTLLQHVVNGVVFLLVNVGRKKYL